ncbi:MAG TPA: hypothetical protein VN690_02275, partial [Terriglobales bacterium]|nr:hypothetical protein [Terriglobales bacterium]
SLVINDDFIAAPGAANPGVDLAPVGPAGRAGLRLHPDYEDYGCGYVGAWVEADPGPMPVGNSDSTALRAEDCFGSVYDISADANWEVDSAYGSISLNGDNSFDAENAGTGYLEALDACEWWQVDDDPWNPPFGDLDFDCGSFDSGTIHVYPTISNDSSVWWFGGEPGGGAYNTQGQFSTDSTGDVEWTVVQGSDKGSLDSESASSPVFTPAGFPYQSQDWSDSFCASVTVNGESAEANGCIVVRIPWKFVPLNPPTTDTSSESTVFVDYIYYHVFEYISGGSALPVMPLNEYFPDGVAYEYPGANWIRGAPNGAYSDSGGLVVDEMAPSVGSGAIPQAYFDHSCGPTQVMNWQQQFFAGSTAPGSGFQVQEDQQTFYQNCGRHENPVSPYWN